MLEAPAIIIIQERTSARAGIHRESERSVDRLVGVLLQRSQRQHGSRANVERHRLEIHFARDLAATVDFLLGPEVEPRTAREVEPAFGRSLLRYRCHEDVASPVELIAPSHRRGIVGMMQPERAHHGEPGLVRLARRGVDVRHHAVAQLEILPDHRLDPRVVQIRWVRAPLRGAERAAVALGPTPRQPQIPVATVSAEARAERAELEPARVQLAGVFVRRIEAADVASPVRKAGEPAVDRHWHVCLERLPRAARVARPYESAVALDPG